jgi:hypothetical protein
MVFNLQITGPPLEAGSPQECRYLTLVRSFDGGG